MSENKWHKHDRPDNTTIPLSWYSDVVIHGYTFSAQIIAYNGLGNGPYTIRTGFLGSVLQDEWSYEYHLDPVRVLKDAMDLAIVLRDSLAGAVIQS
jgi:hypothetical protein